MLRTLLRTVLLGSAVVVTALALSPGAQAASLPTRTVVCSAVSPVSTFPGEPVFMTPVVTREPGLVLSVPGLLHVGLGERFAPRWLVCTTTGV